MSKEKVTSNPDQAKKLLSVERDQKVMESLYLYLLQKKEENEISMTYTPAPTQVVDMPHGSSFPTYPNKKSVLLAAILIGLLLPAVIIFVRESLNTTVRGKLDIESRTQIPVVGELPLFDNGKKRMELNGFHFKKIKGAGVCFHPCWCSKTARTPLTKHSAYCAPT